MKNQYWIYTPQARRLKVFARRVQLIKLNEKKGNGTVTMALKAANIKLAKKISDFNG